MKKYILSTVFGAFLSYSSLGFSASELPDIFIVKDGEQCETIIATDNIDPLEVISTSITENGYNIDYEVLNDDFDLVLKINKCDSIIKASLSTTNGMDLSKDFNLDERLVTTRGAKSKALKASLKSSARMLRSNNFYKFINKVEGWGAPRWVTNAIKNNRHGIANKLDELSTYATVNKNLIHDQVRNFLVSQRVTPWIANWAGWAIANIVNLAL